MMERSYGIGMMDHGELFEVNWVSLPDAPYVIKYKFHETGYNILASNVTLIYNEKLENEKVQERFCKLNPHAEMKVPAIVENLKRSLEMCITRQSDYGLRLEGDKLILTLRFPAAQVMCRYDIEMDLMEPELVLHHIIRPTLLGSLMCQMKMMEIELKRKMNEYIKLPTSPRSAVPTKIIVDPGWLCVPTIPNKRVKDSLLKVQNQYKELCGENSEKCSASKNKKSSSAVVQATSPRKKRKLEENFIDESMIVYTKKSKIKTKLEKKCGESVSSQSQKNKKKREKRKFKI